MVGESDGRPYFSLEFSKGGSLADKLHGDPMPFRRPPSCMVVLGPRHRRGASGRIVQSPI